jgi:splicing factor 3B subunit 2
LFFCFRSKFLFSFAPLGWGKPPVDEYGRPLYGDVFGMAAVAEPQNPLIEPIEKQRWGELEVEPEEEAPPEQAPEEEEAAILEGQQTPAPLDKTGLETPSGMETPGMETPAAVELRKGRNKRQRQRSLAFVTTFHRCL